MKTLKNTVRGRGEQHYKLNLSVKNKLGECGGVLCI